MLVELQHYFRLNYKQLFLLFASFGNLNTHFIDISMQVKTRSRDFDFITIFFTNSYQQFVKLLILSIRLTGSASLWFIPETPISIVGGGGEGMLFVGFGLMITTFYKFFNVTFHFPHYIFNYSFSRSFDSWNWICKKAFSVLICSFSLLWSVNSFSSFIKRISTICFQFLDVDSTVSALEYKLFPQKTQILRHIPIRLDITTLSMFRKSLKKC